MFHRESKGKMFKQPRCQISLITIAIDTWMVFVHLRYRSCRCALWVSGPSGATLAAKAASWTVGRCSCASPSVDCGPARPPAAAASGRSPAGPSLRAAPVPAAGPASESCRRAPERRRWWAASAASSSATSRWFPFNEVFTLRWICTSEWFSKPIIGLWYHYWWPKYLFFTADFDYSEE